MDLEEERDSLRRELIGMQEMLAFILQEVGEPVVVRKEDIAKGLGPDVSISIYDDAQLEAFVFSLETNV